VSYNFRHNRSLQLDWLILGIYYVFQKWVKMWIVSKFAKYRPMKLINI